MTVLEAPQRTRGREQAAELLERQGESLEGQEVEVHFAAEALVTTSFVDEILRAVLVDHKAASLRFVGLPAMMHDLVDEAARHFGVEGRVEIAPRG